MSKYWARDTNSRYIYVSGIDAYSLVSDFLLDKELIINGKKDIASNIKLGDVIEFLDYRNKPMTISVKYIGFSRFPSSCFTGNCKVNTYKGEMQVADLSVGDKILTPKGIYATIKCILVTKIKEITPMMTHTGGLVITGYHPVKINKSWVFPINGECFTQELRYVDCVYSIGLEDDSSFIVNGLEVIGLGHGITDDPVATHPYFGTDKVIGDIFKLSPDGYCVIKQKQITRDPETLLVNGIQSNCKFESMQNNI